MSTHDHSGPGHGGDDHDMTVWLEPGPWEERYAASVSVWSGNPNAVLVAEAGDLAPGRALEVGSGEGADAIWLAARGWQVTAVDFSAVALAKAAGHAEAAGVAERVEWRQEDVRVWAVPPTAYDLVTSHFLHLPPDDLARVLDGLEAAVAPGGTLLVVGHHPSDLETSMGRPGRGEMMFTAERLAARLDPAAWAIEVAEARPRSATDPDGVEITIRDAVLRARRR